MRPLRAAIRRSLPSEGEPYGEGPLPRPDLRGDVARHAAPLLYDGDTLTIGYAARTVNFTMTVTGLSLSMLTLKRHLVLAEMRQREIAERDALTGITSRRGYHKRAQENRRARRRLRPDHVRLRRSRPGPPRSEGWPPEARLPSPR